MSSNESKIPVGTLLVGKYRVAREIGRGGMAAVYEAEQLSLGKKVAVKILASELAASTIVIERFFREARAAASVKSPYIVDVYDSGRLDDGRPFIAMELLEGESLYDRMARVRIVDVDTTIRVIVHTARGLIKAHGAGIVHRDLKPENIFLTKGEDGDDVIKILDFGLAKFYAPVNPEEKAAKRLTREGAVFGTPAYMSPEQVKGQGNVDHRADLWALGCMAYECLIGRPVWNMDQGVAMTFAAIATGPIPVPSSARGDLPPALDAWFRKCLERDPDRRYQGARELADAFVESWGHRPASSASFPNVNMSSGSGRYPPAVNPAAPGEGELQLVADTVEATLQQIPQPANSQRRVGSPGGPMNGRVGSVQSDVSLPLLHQRQSGDIPFAAERDASSPRARASPVRVVISATFLAGGISAAIFVWLRFLNPQVFTPVVHSTAIAAPVAIPSGTGGTGPAVDDPKWAPAVAESQRLFTAGELGSALKKLADASATGPQGAAVAKVYADQFKFMTSKEVSGGCKPVAFSRPRLFTERPAERPSIRATPKGMLVTWTDDHVVKDRDHVYGVLLNDTGKPIGPVRDLTPEATDAQRPQLIAQSADSERTVLLYWDKSGKEAGVRVRFLDADGRIDGNNGGSHMVGAAGRPGDYWPSIDRGPKGFYVVWQDDRDKDKEYDLFVRTLSNDLETLSPETRLTDYHAAPKTKQAAPRVRYPSVAVAADTLLVAYRLENDKERERGIVRLRVPLADFEKQNGLPELKDPSRESRVFGDAKTVSADRSPSDAPAVACGTEGCFVVWHHEQGGASVAAIDPNVGNVQWHNKFSVKGGRPSIAVNDGQVAISYYEKGIIKMIFLSRDGVSQPSSLLRVLDGNSPRPSLAAGSRKGEWTVAWQDSDVPKGTAEIYAARIVCRTQ